MGVLGVVGLLELGDLLLLHGLQLLDLLAHLGPRLVPAGLALLQLGQAHLQTLDLEALQVGDVPHQRDHLTQRRRGTVLRAGCQPQVQLSLHVVHALKLLAHCVQRAEEVREQRRVRLLRLLAHLPLARALLAGRGQPGLQALLLELHLSAERLLLPDARPEGAQVLHYFVLQPRRLPQLALQPLQLVPQLAEPLARTLSRRAHGLLQRAHRGRVVPERPARARRARFFVEVRLADVGLGPHGDLAERAGDGGAVLLAGGVELEQAGVFAGELGALLLGEVAGLLKFALELGHDGLERVERGLAVRAVLALERGELGVEQVLVAGEVLEAAALALELLGEAEHVGVELRGLGLERAHALVLHAQLLEQLVQLVVLFLERARLAGVLLGAARQLGVLLGEARVQVVGGLGELARAVGAAALVGEHVLHLRLELAELLDVLLVLGLLRALQPRHAPPHALDLLLHLLRLAFLQRHPPLQLEDARVLRLRLPQRPAQPLLQLRQLRVQLLLHAARQARLLHDLLRLQRVLAVVELYFLCVSETSPAHPRRSAPAAAASRSAPCTAPPAARAPAAAPAPPPARPAASAPPAAAAPGS